MKTTSRRARLLVPALVALLLALRVLSPTGFMPSFDHGSLAVVICDDGNTKVSSPHKMHHRGGKQANHAPCPYAAAASVASLGPDFAPVIDVLVFGAILLVGLSFGRIERKGVRARPPTRAPPFPA